MRRQLLQTCTKLSDVFGLLGYFVAVTLVEHFVQTIRHVPITGLGNLTGKTTVDQNNRKSEISVVLQARGHVDMMKSLDDIAYEM